jgi:hypothetical protein
MKTLAWISLLGGVGLLGAGACSPGLGKTCSTEAQCSSGLVCSFAPGDGGTGICDYPLRAEGEPCSLAAECETTLTCSTHFTSNERYGTCTPKRDDGAQCFADQDCRSGRCAGKSGTALDGTCAPRP